MSFVPREVWIEAGERGFFGPYMLRGTMVDDGSTAVIFVYQYCRQRRGMIRTYDGAGCIHTSGGELRQKLVLLAGLLQPGAPQLVRDESQDHGTGDDEESPGDAQDL